VSFGSRRAAARTYEAILRGNGLPCEEGWPGSKRSFGFNVPFCFASTAFAASISLHRSDCIDLASSGTTSSLVAALSRMKPDALRPRLVMLVWFYGV
jgi:hypothetical protein